MQPSKKAWLEEIVDEALSEWHYDHDGMSEGSAHRHGSFSDSVAFTHCICYGAGWRVAEAMQAECDRLVERAEAAEKLNQELLARNEVLAMAVTYGSTIAEAHRRLGRAISHIPDDSPST